MSPNRTGIDRAYLSKRSNYGHILSRYTRLRSDCRRLKRLLRDKSSTELP